MSAKIIKLPESVKCQLRSELAITSTAQCVEELVLNAIDSTCCNIAVRLDLDIFKITVVDDGDGICEDGLNMLGSRYVTSKCSSIKDLETNLKYFGYRGEALASIISTSAIVEITSKAKLRGETYSRLFLYGKSNGASAKDVSRPSFGTTVTITDFMYNLPVRRKLIKPTFDIESCRERLEGIALVNHRVSFSLTTEKNKCIVMKTKRCKAPAELFKQLYGLQYYLFEFEYISKPYTIAGFISKQPHQSKSLQLIYVNKRRVFNKKILSLTKNVLSKSAIMQRKPSPSFRISPSMSPTHIARQYCLFLINIKCPFDEYDISFEPTKSKVEFVNMEKLLKTIELALLCILKRENLILQKDEASVSSHNDVLPSEIMSPDDRQPSLNKLSVFASKFTIKPSDLGSLESLPARRNSSINDNKSQCTLTKNNTNDDLTNTVTRNLKHAVTQTKSSIQQLRDQVKNVPTILNCSVSSEGNILRKFSSLDTFKRMYFGCNNNILKPHSESGLRMIRSAVSDRDTSGEKYSRKMLNLRNRSSTSNSSGRQQHHILLKKNQMKHVLPMNTERKCNKKSIFDKSFYFNPQLQSNSLQVEETDQSIIDWQTSSDVMEGLFDVGHNTPVSISSTDNYLISAMNEPHAHDQMKEINNIENHFYNIPNTALKVGIEEDNSVVHKHVSTTETSLLPSVQSSHFKTTVPHDTGNSLRDYIATKDSNGRQVYINHDTGNSSYIQPVKRDDQIWKNNFQMGEIFLPHSSGYNEPFTEKFINSRGQISGITKRKYPVESLGANKCLKMNNVAFMDKTNNWKCAMAYENGKHIESQDLLDKWKADELLFVQETLKNNEDKMLKYIYQDDVYRQKYDNSIGNSSIPCYKISQPYKLDKAILKQAKVIGQVDKKFISITVPYMDCSAGQSNNTTEHNLLVLIDQHAADERIQLEKILDENYELNCGNETIRWSVIDPPFQLEFKSNEVILLAEYEDIFENFGLYYVQTDATVIEFTAIPSILVPKDNSEKHTRRCQLAPHIVESTVKAICATISTLRGSSVDFKERRPLPQPLSYVFNTYACKAAIKFGDLLAVEECQSLLDSLSECKLPFQCAHGRPSVYPLLEFGHLSNNALKQGSKIDLKKLRKLMK